MTARVFARLAVAVAAVALALSLLGVGLGDRLDGLVLGLVLIALVLAFREDR